MLEKKDQTLNYVHGISKESDVLTEDDEILGAMCGFYKNLYTSKSASNKDIDLYLNDIDLNKLSDTDKDMCDFFPSLSEYNEAVANMKWNISSGLDGIPIDFYKCLRIFYDIIMMKEIFMNRKMTYSQRLTVISFIHKKGERKIISIMIKIYAITEIPLIKNNQIIMTAYGYIYIIN